MAQSNCGVDKSLRQGLGTRKRVRFRKTNERENRVSAPASVAA